MALFQQSVLLKHLKGQDQEKVLKAYKKYIKYFHNPTIQQNIKDSKEEQYQAKFLDELFVNVLGYTLSPQPNFNITTEFKNEKNSKKADGAILKNDQAIAVIELKGTKTKDLDSITSQAFNYKANQTGCVYVVTSNFEKLRFYVNNAVDFEEFHLFNLSEERFALLYLCLHKDNIFSNVGLTIKESSIREEENITKKFYGAYSLFKRELYRDLVKSNVKNPVFRDVLDNEEFDEASKNIKRTLFKKSQKLIDRYLFIFFGEDRGLLPPNSTVMILEDWKKLIDLDAVVPLYDRFKLYFNYLDTGRKGTDSKKEIFAYNGGLFKPDAILDSIIIDDDLLYKHTKELSHYNFESQIDVNILGHIFENSLNEIESINAEIEGTDFDKQTSKRKKDGVFYTPKYITKYIVDNTVGKLCTEKKIELKLIETEYLKSRKGRPADKLKQLQGLLVTYREWLLTLTIVDPACGSGAFLNQALDLLIGEHRYLDELEASLLGGSIVFQDIENTILEKNIFGVDLNDESVEIAKLSLWLRTAQPRRKLNDLSSNIKCGNSLIDVKSIAGDKAFNWEEEFPEVFANGGFDVVIGNPPYGAQVSKQDKEYYKKHYSVTEYNYDTYNFFFEKSLQILKPDCYLGFITPNTFLVVENGVLLRNLLIKENTLIELYETFNVFPDAVVEPMNIIIQKTQPNSTSKFKVITQSRSKKETTESQFSLSDVLANKSLIFNYRESKKERDLFNKVRSKSRPLSDYAKVTTGIKPYQTGKGIPKQTKETVKEKPFTSFTSKGDDWQPLVRGTQINRYLTKWDGEYIQYGPWLAEPRKPKLFFEEKLLIRRTDDNILCSFDNKNYVGVNSIHAIQSITTDIPNKALLGVLNAKITNWFFRHANFHMVDKPLAEVKVVYVERLPLLFPKEVSNLSSYVDSLLEKNNTLFLSSSKFINYLCSSFSLSEINKKLQNWHELEFGDFITELNKAIKKAGGEKLSKMDEMEWMEVFETKKAEAQTLKSEIDKTDAAIDKMVYELYGLTDKEITIVENS